MCMCAYTHIPIYSICTLIHFYIQYVDVLASDERNYQCESFLLVKGEWNISQSITFSILCIFWVCVWSSWTELCIRDMLIKDASDASNYCKQNASFSFFGISVRARYAMCSKHRPSCLSRIFIWNDTLLDRYHGAQSPCCSTDHYEWPTDRSGSRRRKITV